MRARRAVLTAALLVLAFVFVSASAGKPRPAPTDKQAPTTPTNLRITASSDTSLSLTWNASTDNTTNWWYCIQVDGVGCDRVDPPQTTFTRSNLTPGQTTTWTVYAIDAAGNRSANSNAVVFTTPASDTTAPSPPPVVSAAIVHPTWVVISWTKSYDTAFPDLTYQVLLDGRLVWDSAAYTHFNVLHLLPESTHEFQVLARDAYGNTAAGNVLTVTTPAKRDDNPPTAPQNVKLGFQSGDGDAWLTWDESTDDTDPQGSIRYEAYFNGVSNDSDGAIGSNGTIAYCRGATGPTEIVVRAHDTSGNVSGPSNVILFDC